ncbi:MAG: hypothetical protein SFU98_08305 [Leptospiraceae bacterium]|nr:hypothetical protein [Leptospiraceae bacterium]
MMIIRLTSFFVIALLSLEVLAISAVCWSFYESLGSSVSLLKYTSDNKARDILSTIARVSETKMSVEGQREMNDFFGKLIKQSEKDQDKFLLKEIFILSNDGTVLSHNNPSELKTNEPDKYNKPYYMRALRMRKGQLPTPQIIGKENEGDGTMLGNWMLRFFPDLKFQTILLSSPIYHTEKLEAIGSIHLIYNRGNVQYLLSNQREIFIWMLSNYVVIAFLATLIIWAIFAFFSFSIYRLASFQGSTLGATESKSKLKSFLDEKENTLKQYITGKNKFDSSISLNIQDVDPFPPTSPMQEIKLDITNVSPEKKKDIPKQNPTEAMDAIFLD